jgi:hypothetical protein
MKERTPIHIVIRYSDKLHNVGDVIGKHIEVIQTHSNVWFGKIGRPLAQMHVDTVNKQCVDGTPTYLYLVQKKGSKYSVYQGTVLKMSRLFPEEQHLVPKYYFSTGIVNKIQLWVLLSEIKPLAPKKLRELRALTSVMSMSETLAKSMAAHFIVREYEPHRGLLPGT